MHRSRLALFAGAVAAAAMVLPVQSQDEPPNGVRTADLRVHAITDATVVIRPGETIENATIVIRDGVIESVGKGVVPPREARIWSGEGLTIYPGLIDAAVLVDPGVIERGPYAHWNRHIHPELRAADRDIPEASMRKSLRELGFTTAAVFPEDGILRGTGVVLSLADESRKPTVYVEQSMMGAGFDRGGGYPGSLMGSIASFRQAMLDADWYRKSYDIFEEHPQGHEPPAKSESFEALKPVITGGQALLFEVDDEHSFLRAARVIEEFDLNAVVLGSGEEFRRVQAVAATGLPIVLPIDYPDRPDVSTLDAADSTTLEAMLNWEQAPTNPRRLIDAGATIALTTHGLNQKKNFFGNIRRAMNNGLAPDAALAALTTTPAELLGVDHLMGTIEQGKVANLVVIEGELFDKEAKVRDTWIDGRRYEINPAEDPGYSGSGRLVINEGVAQPVETTIRIDTKKKSVTVELPDGETAKAKQVTWDGSRLSFLVDGRLLNTQGYVQFAGTLTDGSFAGSGALPDRSRFTFTIEPIDEELETGDEDAAADQPGDEAADDERAAGDDTRDPVTGTWSAVIATEQMGDLPLSLDLQLEDNVVRGSLESEFFNAEVSEGTFNESTGAVSFMISGGGMTSQFEGTIKDDAIEGEITNEAFSAELTGARAQVGGGGGRGQRGGGNRDAEEKHVAPEDLVYPLGAFGLPAPPQKQNVLVTNATIWTCGEAGIIDNGSMLVLDGKVAFVGATDAWQDFAARARLPQYSTVDARGKHITPGLIDCHSHTGISGGVNEGSQVVTAEVRIGDCVNPDDINWYRQLAGGLTGANQLHGSANPIGGQNSVVKLKWGHNADSFNIEDAIAGIKFALGENVKRSQNRYPNTRMGVETVIVDAFTRAQDYRAEWEKFNALTESEKARTMPPRRDLELDALVEILEGERLVHCHSYRQDEILMLLRTAERFGFTVGTLQHILEGYKVAEAIASHGAGASSFSDWWAYKVEVMDAIPYNGTMMHKAGIVVSFNSDSSELARRMNTEASKAVRYGGLEPEEALKFVTLNPAKQLRIDHRVGSLEQGKDADFVIWSGDPLSTYTICEQTWIEGARYFSLEEDAKLREQVANERQRLIQTILAYEHGDPDETAKEDDKDTAGTETTPG